MQLRNNVTLLHRTDWPRCASMEANVRNHLETLLVSPHFDASSRSREFLQYVVDEALAGRGAALNQAAIATTVFRRRADFDPVLDPIVRVQAGRLRRSLERYYLISGAGQPLRIELPKGGYAPIFVARGAESQERPLDASTPAPTHAPSSPTLLVHAFEISSVLDDHAASSIAEELTIELNRYGAVQVVRQRDLDRLAIKPPATVRFELRGRVRMQGDSLLVSARLIDRLTGEQIWSDELNAGAAPDACGAGVDDIARIVAARIGADQGIIVRAVAGLAEARRAPSGEVDETVLRRHRFFLSGRPEDFSAALEGARRLVEREPDAALAWMSLARLYLANHCYEISAPPTPIEAALAAANRAVLLDPTSVRVRCTLAAGLLVHGDLEAALRELERAQLACGDSLAYRETIGWLTALAGDWTRGVALIRDALNRNPFCPAHAQQALWADHLRRGELSASYVAALEHHDPTSFWRELMSACSLGHLGRSEDAAACMRELLRFKPEFPLRARALIACYIKAPELRELIIAGLRLAGLPVTA